MAKLRFLLAEIQLIVSRLRNGPRGMKCINIFCISDHSQYNGYTMDILCGLADGLRKPTVFEALSFNQMLDRLNPGGWKLGHCRSNNRSALLSCTST